MSESNLDGADRPAKTPVVLLLLAGASAVFSYLWAYCLTDALVAAEIRSPISGGADPRPRWFVTGWIALMSGFSLLGWVMKLASARQIRSIDQMEADDHAP